MRIGNALKFKVQLMLAGAHVRGTCVVWFYLSVTATQDHGIWPQFGCSCH